MLNYNLFYDVTRVTENGRRKGLKKSDFPEFENDMKALKVDFNTFTQQVVDAFNDDMGRNVVKTVGVHKNYQNSGYYNPYFWNKIIKSSSTFDGIAIWLVINAEGMHITVGTTRSIEDTSDDQTINRINQQLIDACTQNLEGFENKIDNIYASFKYIKDEIDINLFLDVLHYIFPLYEDALVKFNSNQVGTPTILEDYDANGYEKYLTNIAKKENGDAYLPNAVTNYVADLKTALVIFSKIEEYKDFTLYEILIDFTNGKERSSSYKAIEFTEIMNRENRVDTNLYRAILIKAKKYIDFLTWKKNNISIEKKFFTPGDPFDNRYVQDVDHRKKFWVLGASWNKVDMTEIFVSENRWENGYSDKYISKVNEIQTGDFVAIKASYVRKNNLPFNNHNKFVSVMKIKAIGQVTVNLMDGKNLQVDWNENFKPKEIYVYSYRSTISIIDHERWPETVHWLFYDYNQSPKFLENEIVKSHNLILEEYVESAKEIFKKRFSAFLDFQRPGKKYLEEEYDYKKEMIEEAKKYVEELSKDNFSSNIQKILEPITDANFFNWRDIESFINLTSSEEEVIYTQTKKLMLSVKENRIKDDFDAVVNEFSKVITHKNVVWLYVSYILFVFDDKNHMAMKSSVIDSIMKFFGKESVARGTKITYKIYMEVIDFANEVAALLEDWKPKDMIDIHSFFWVVANNDDVLDQEEKIEQDKKDINMSLNTILYGPPGTGKTYYTINTALEIIDSEFYENHKNNRDELNEKFEEYKKSGQIVFITFHQSYGYEEFIEGIRANTNDDTISYAIEDGSFKLISDKAFENYKNHKNYLTIGSHEKQVNIELLMNDYSNYVSEELEKGNEVAITSDIGMHNRTLLGSINKSADGSFRSFYTTGSVNNQSLTRSIVVRDFQNFINGKIQSYQDIEPRYDSKSSYHGNAIYYFELYTALKSYFDRDEDKYMLDTDEVKLKNFVLIIDEINRGNISKIFGELITLIEANKRLGADESASITLPYSQESFTVPNNLYLVGTMNTADRSIALLDTALRRRFDFIEMMPEHTLNEINTNIEGSGINLQEILRTINERIEYLYDRDHTIGHSYFMGVDTLDELTGVMKNKIIPLLQEYFYDDWEKIQIVLGDHHKQLGSTKDADSFEDEINKLRFVQSERKREKNVLGFNHEDIEDEQISYRVSDSFIIETYRKIYEKIDTQNA